MTMSSALAHITAALGAIAPDVDAAADLDADLHDDLQLDSMDLITLAAELGRRTGVDIPERDYPALRTVRQLADYLAVRMG